MYVHVRAYVQMPGCIYGDQYLCKNRVFMSVHVHVHIVHVYELYDCVQHCGYTDSVKLQYIYVYDDDDNIMVMIIIIIIITTAITSSSSL